MTINLKIPDIRELKPRITVFGVGGAGGNAVNNMISAGLQGVDFVVANTDAQALTMSKAERIIQMGVQVTEGLGAGSQPDVGRAAAEEVIDEIRDHLSGAHMVFVTAGMGGGTGTGAAPVIARAAQEAGILTVGVVTKPFHFEGQRRMRVADGGITELQKCVDTLLIIPNQNLFRVANEKTTFADAFAMADQVLYSGVACITDLMVKEGLINLDFADVRAVMREMGKAMMGTGEAEGDKRAMTAAEAAISNPLIDDASMKGAKGLLISISGGRDLTLYEVDEAATRIREEVDQDANIIVGATFDEGLEGIIRVSVVATGIDHALAQRPAAAAAEARIAEVAQRLRADNEKLGAPGRANRAGQADRCASCRGGASAGNAQRFDRIRQGSGGRGHPAAGRRLGGDDPAARAEAFVVHRSGGQRTGAAGAGGVHSAAAGTHAVAQHAHAAHRRTAGSGPERAPRPPWRTAGGASGEKAHVAVAAAGRGRSRPPRAGRRRSVIDACQASAAAADAARAARAAFRTAGAAAGVASGTASRTGVRIRQAVGAPWTGPPRTAGPCA